MKTAERRVPTKAARALAPLTIAAVGFAALSPARADVQFGDILRGVAGQIPSAAAAARNRPAPTSTPSPANSAAPGAMSLQQQPAGAPLHRLGVDAVAVVEASSGTAPVQQMDYVFAGQTIALGATGKVTLSYLSGCLTEVVQGGVVTVAAGGSKVARGRLDAKATPGCRTARPIILASASEAGATINRITPFSGVNWDERVLKSGQPVFKWDKALGVAAVRIRDMDKPGEPVLWQAAADQDWAAYPPKAARLAPGAPFKAEALVGDRVVASGLFSIDPALDVADNLANRIVPLSAP